MVVEVGHKLSRGRTRPVRARVDGGIELCISTLNCHLLSGGIHEADNVIHLFPAFVSTTAVTWAITTAVTRALTLTFSACFGEVVCHICGMKCHELGTYLCHAVSGNSGKRGCCPCRWDLEKESVVVESALVFYRHASLTVGMVV